MEAEHLVVACCDRWRCSGPEVEQARCPAFARAFRGMEAVAGEMFCRRRRWKLETQGPFVARCDVDCRPLQFARSSGKHRLQWPGQRGKTVERGQSTEDDDRVRRLAPQQCEDAVQVPYEPVGVDPVSRVVDTDGDEINVRAGHGRSKLVQHGRGRRAVATVHLPLHVALQPFVQYPGVGRRQGMVLLADAGAGHDRIADSYDTHWHACSQAVPA